MRRIVDVEHTREKKKRSNLRGKDACKRDMTGAELNDDNSTNRAAGRNNVVSYTGDPR